MRMLSYFVFISLFFCAFAQAQNRYALLVGVDVTHSNYPTPPLSCCVNDVFGMQADMLAADGLQRWPPENVQALTNGAVGKSTVRAAFHGLAATAGADDIALYYQSSHGGRFSGYDCYLCTYDANYTDVEFGADLALFDPGTKVVVILDACHSGGMFKGGAGAWPFAERAMAAYRTAMRTRLAAEGRPAPKALGTNIAFITSCDYNELSETGTPYSLFTGHLLDACYLPSLDANDDGDYEFYEFFPYARDQTSAIDTNQVPQCLNENLLQNVSARTVARGIPMVSAGSTHSVGLKSNGRIWQWGYCYGQSWAPGDTNLFDPYPITTVTDIVAVAAGEDHTLARLRNGNVMAWGWNALAGFGDGTTNSSYLVARQTMISDAAVMDASYHSHARDRLGVVWGWGYNIDGQVGNGSASTCELAPGMIAVPTLPMAISIADGLTHSVFALSNGTVWACGSNKYGELGDDTTNGSYSPVLVTGLSNVIAVAAGNYFSLALKRDGTVWAWGMGTYGQIGDGASQHRLMPVQVSGLTGVVAIAAGLQHGLALMSDGLVWGWGSDWYGQLANPPLGDCHPTPVRAYGVSDVRSIAAGDWHSLALKNDGTVWAWGRNNGCQLGTWTPEPESSAPVQVEGLNLGESTGCVNFSPTNYVASENAGCVTVTVVRTGGCGGVASVYYSTADGTAVTGSDYLAVSGLLTWTNGDSADKTFTVSILSDVVRETNETFTVSLASARGAELGSPATAEVVIANIPFHAVFNDYDGDGKSDLAVFDQNTGWWYVRSLNGTLLAWAFQWGWPGARPVSGDYNGDGIYDCAVFDSNTGYWYIAALAEGQGSGFRVQERLTPNTEHRTPITGSPLVIAWAFQWGWPGAWPVSGDYDGDGLSDCAVFDQNTGWWYVRTLDGRVLAWEFQWGWPGAWPVSGDYDGDGISDCAVFDRNTGFWHVITLDNQLLAWDFQWGWPDALPVIGDYDGDGLSDFAVFDQNSGWWYVAALTGVQSSVSSIQTSKSPNTDNRKPNTTPPAPGTLNTEHCTLNTGSPRVIAWEFQWGWPGALPVPGDYDGDGLSDFAVFDQNSGCWYIAALAEGQGSGFRVQERLTPNTEHRKPNTTPPAPGTLNTGSPRVIAWQLQWGWPGAWPVGWR